MSYKRTSFSSSSSYESLRGDNPNRTLDDIHHLLRTTLHEIAPQHYINLKSITSAKVDLYNTTLTMSSGCVETIKTEDFMKLVSQGEVNLEITSTFNLEPWTLPNIGEEYPDFDDEDEELLYSKW